MTENWKQAAEEPPIQRLVDLIIRQAINEKATEIRLQPLDTAVQLQYKIENQLEDIAPPDKRLYRSIVARIKSLAKVDVDVQNKVQEAGNPGTHDLFQ